MYRAQSDVDYPLENHNSADLAGVLWYVHNEIMGKNNWPKIRKYNITRILRFKVTMRTTDAFFDSFRKQFGPFVAFDNEKCTANDCDSIWAKYGFVVGCQVLNRDVANYVNNFAEVPQRQLCDGPGCGQSGGLRSASAGREGVVGAALDTVGARAAALAPVSMLALPGGAATSLRPGIWYSLPGPCPSKVHAEKTDGCSAVQPGGRCSSVTGEPDCTFRADFAGEVRLDQLCGIADYAAFRKAGHQEYDDVTDLGVKCSFWDGKRDLQKCTQRLQHIQKLFADKYTDLPASLPTPPCL
mmetsp:Transcript_106709/g.301812  ORF Transcript_106709/g.301812 Transcript_106709/m.301812 type:complete len:298 (-) Transcript_106709:131-1024(-)|eukprot:CAMPEP_0168472790 /NCGR_PEP_ID=MMETSP0228-20121227/59982_1 /TAXON_ID=133427 /ORGANISM="Protoceratium reticulatum, Strain CCCM 535 (=CCMP 1889)" /LENGTH=297 /DNA_ID=CAMNT_0008488747 /DNA_START=1 /DNA_END=894 /DNA_ORIENTATION=-